MDRPCIQEPVLSLEEHNANELQTKPHMPRVVVFGVRSPLVLSSAPNTPSFEADELVTLCHPTDDDLNALIVSHRPHCFVTVGKKCEDYPNLFNSPWQVRRRWLHFPDDAAPTEVGRAAFGVYMNGCVDALRNDVPLVSVYTPTYKTGERFERAWRGMRDQTFKNWEWVLVDDSDDNGETLAMLHGYAERDHRIRVYKPTAHTGIIGEVKYQASMLTRGDYLVELDHDDELTLDALRMVVDGFAKHPDAGFLTTDWCEVFEDDLSNRTYGGNFGYGLCSYRDETYGGHLRKVVNQPYISPKAIRCLVAAPNHLRAWRRDCYMRINGHSRALGIADDLELLMRTFLDTRMVHVKKLGYIQYFAKSPQGNTQLARNGDIQRHVRYLRQHYDQRIHDRFLELGCDDYIWDEHTRASDLRKSNPDDVPHVSYIVA